LFLHEVGCMRLAYSLQRGCLFFVTLMSAVVAVHCRTLTVLVVRTKGGACWSVSGRWVAKGAYVTSYLALAVAAAVAAADEARGEGEGAVEAGAGGWGWERHRRGGARS